MSDTTAERHTKIIISGVDRSAEAFNSAANNMRKAGQQGSGAMAEVKSLAGQATSQVWGLSKAMLAAAGAAVAMSTVWKGMDAAMNKERLMGRTQIAFRLTTEELQKLDDRLEKIEERSTVPFEKLRDAAGAVKKEVGEISIDKLGDVLETVADLSLVTGHEADKIGRMAGAMMRNFKIAPEDMRRQMEILWNTLGGEFSDVSDDVVHLTSLMADFGYKGEYGARVMAAMIKQGRTATGSAAESTQNLISVLERLGGEGFQKLGIGAEDIAQQMKAGGDVMAYVARKAWIEAGGDYAKLNELVGTRLAKTFRAYATDQYGVGRALEKQATEVGRLDAAAEKLANDTIAKRDRRDDAVKDANRDMWSLDSARKMYDMQTDAAGKASAFRKEGMFGITGPALDPRDIEHFKQLNEQRARQGLEPVRPYRIPRADPFGTDKKALEKFLNEHPEYRKPEAPAGTGKRSSVTDTEMSGRRRMPVESETEDDMLKEDRRGNGTLDMILQTLIDIRDGRGGAGGGDGYGDGGSGTGAGGNHGTLFRPGVRAPGGEPGASLRRRARRGGGGPAGAGEVMEPGGPPGQYRPIYTPGEKDLSYETARIIAGEAAQSGQSVDAVINNMMNRLGTKGYGPSRNLEEVATAPGQYEAAWRFRGQKYSAERIDFIRNRIKAIASGGVRSNVGGANEFRASSYRGPWYYNNPGAPVVGGNRFGYNPRAGVGPYAPYGTGPGERGGGPVAGGEGEGGERPRNNTVTVNPRGAPSPGVEPMPSAPGADNYDRWQQLRQDMEKPLRLNIDPGSVQQFRRTSARSIMSDEIRRARYEGLADFDGAA